MDIQHTTKYAKFAQLVLSLSGNLPREVSAREIEQVIWTSPLPLS
jgi:hypothetical protein